MDFFGEESLGGRQRYGCIDAQTGVLFNVLGVRDAAIQCIAHEGHHHANQHAKNSRKSDEQALLGLNRLFGNRSIVEQTDVANLTCLDESELLHIIQQTHVEVVVDLYVAHQAQGVLLYIWKGLHAGSHACHLRTQRCYLLIERLHARVRHRKAGQQFRAFLLEFEQAGLGGHALLQECLSFFAEVKRIALIAHLVVLHLGPFQFTLELGQQVTQEDQRLLSLSGFALDVLCDVLLANLVQDTRSKLGVGAVQRSTDDAALLALFGDLELILELFEGFEVRVPYEVEDNARLCLHIAHQQREATHALICGQQLPHTSLEWRVQTGILQTVAPVAQGNQLESFALQGFWHIKFFDVDRLLGPCETTEPEQSRLGQALGAAGNPRAKEREIVRPCGNV
ncbi:hypothetical protein D9M68_597830 [compost metagenome]